MMTRLRQPASSHAARAICAIGRFRRAFERKQRLRVAVLQVIRDLARLQQDVERHDDGAGLEDAEVGDRKPRHVRTRQRDVIAGGDADAHADRRRPALPRH